MNINIDCNQHPEGDIDIQTVTLEDLSVKIELDMDAQDYHALESCLKTITRKNEQRIKDAFEKHVVEVRT